MIELNNVARSIIKIRGYGLVPAPKIEPVIADNAEPIPIMTAIPNPEALPASLGFTDTIPDEAFGRVMPFPSPTKSIGPKRENGLNKEILRNKY